MSTVRRRQPQRSDRAAQQVSRTLLGLALVVALGLAPAQVQAGGFAEAWKISTTSVWPPAVIDGKVVLKNGDSLEAHSLKDGRQLWKIKPGSLRYGAGVLAAGQRYVYVLGGRELYVVNPADGKVVKKKAIKRPSFVYSKGDSVYVVTRAGVSRLSGDGSKLISRAKGYTGEILGADGNYVVLYSQDGGTKRLVVADLKGGKKSYEFKLLPNGWHRVVKVGGSRLVFLDYSQRQSDGSNPKKLYFTEADYVRSKKVKDQALHKRYPATYSSAACDHFWAATDDSGIVFIANYGSPTQQSNLLAYDPGQDKLLWNRSGSVVSMGVLLHGGRLWSGVSDGEGNAYAVAYSPDDGSLLEKLPLDAPGTGAPVAAGRRILVRSRNAIHCFAAGASKPLVLKGAALPSKKDWRMYRDRTTNYLIRTPKTWEFQREKLVKMGGLRMSIPFVRKETVGA